MSRLSNNFSFINRGQQTEQAAANGAEALSPIERELLQQYNETVLASFARLHITAHQSDPAALAAAIGMETAVAEPATEPVATPVAVEQAPWQQGTAFPIDQLEASRRSVADAYETGDTHGKAAT